MRELKFNLDGYILPRRQHHIKISEVAGVIDSQLYTKTACPQEYILKYLLKDGQASPNSLMKEGHKVGNTHSFNSIEQEHYESYLKPDGAFCCFYEDIPFLGAQTGKLESCNLQTHKLIEHTETCRREIEPWFSVQEKETQMFIYAYFLSKLNAGNEWNIEITISAQTKTKIELRYTSVYKYLVESWLEEVIKVNTGEVLIPVRKPDTMRECRTCEPVVRKECERLWKEKVSY